MHSEETQNPIHRDAPTISQLPESAYPNLANQPTVAN